MQPRLPPQREHRRPQKHQAQPQLPNGDPAADCVRGDRPFSSDGPEQHPRPTHIWQSQQHRRQKAEGRWRRSPQSVRRGQRQRRKFEVRRRPATRRIIHRGQGLAPTVQGQGQERAKKRRSGAINQGDFRRVRKKPHQTAARSAGRPAKTRSSHAATSPRRQEHRQATEELDPMRGIRRSHRYTGNFKEG